VTCRCAAPGENVREPVVRAHIGRLAMIRIGLHARIAIAPDFQGEGLRDAKLYLGAAFPI